MIIEKYRFKPISKEIDAICYAEEAIWRDIAEYRALK